MKTDPAAVALVEYALELLGRQDELADDEELLEAFRQAGFDPTDAERLVALLPLAFGRAALQQMGVYPYGDDAHVHHPDGSTTRIHLSDQPIYRAALHLAAEVLRHGSSTSALTNELIGRSVEVRVLGPTLQSGQLPDTRGLAAPHLLNYAKDVFAPPPWWRRRIF